MNASELATQQSMSASPASRDETSPELTEFLDILKPLIREPAVVGNEDSFFRVLRRELEEIDINVHYSRRHLG